MNIDYYCYVTNEFEFMESLGLVTKENERGYVERAKEIIQHNNYLFWVLNPDDFKEAINQNKLLVYDYKTDMFHTLNNEVVDIQGERILPRTTNQLTKLMIDKIGQYQGESVPNRADYNKTKYWFNHVETDRKMKSLTYGEFTENITKFMNEFSDNNYLFLKTVDKGISRICTTMSFSFMGDHHTILCTPDKHNFPFSGLRREDDILISQPVNIIQDEYGNKEYRAVVVDDELLNISRFYDYDVEVEDYVRGYAQLKLDEIKGKMPSTYCMDIFEYVDEYGQNKLDICEFNNIISAGIYYNNFIVPKEELKKYTLRK